MVFDDVLDILIWKSRMIDKNSDLLDSCNIHSSITHQTMNENIRNILIE